MLDPFGQGVAGGIAIIIFRSDAYHAHAVAPSVGDGAADTLRRVLRGY
jgi:hypothetical protein